MGNDAASTTGRTRGATPGTGIAVPRAGMASNTPVRYRDLNQAKSQYPLDMFNYSARANDRAFGDYDEIMGDYRSLYDKISGRPSTEFSWNPVSYSRPGELTEAFGSLRNAGAGYQKFADTGGYSDQDVQELRARGIAPIRSAYGNTVRELDRARSLSGGGANYIAARSRAQREMPGQMADAMTTVNAGLAEAIRSGKLAGLSGLTNVGSTMGGLSSQEAAQILQAAMANSQGSLNAAGMTENARQFDTGMLSEILGRKSNLYGTTPGMANMFGNQAMSYLNTMNRNPKAWEQIMSILGTAAPYVAMAYDEFGNPKPDANASSGGSGGSSGGGGNSGFWSSFGKTALGGLAPLINLFKSKDGPTGTGGGGGGGGTGPRDNTGRGVNDPMQGNIYGSDAQAIAQARQEWRNSGSKLPFEEWFRQKYGGSPIGPPNIPYYPGIPGGM